jgi:23S rRNA pseudouridine1911/1915/1917 synthase
MSAAPPVEIPLPAAFAELSVIEYLAILWPERPRRALEGLFACGRVRSSGKPVGARRLLRELPDLALVGGLEGEPQIHAPGGACGIEILHEDERLIALSKASGVPVVPDRRGSRESCLGFLLRRELASRAAKRIEEYVRPRIVHRIDRLTSGLVLVAKTPEAERDLAKAFERREVWKEYLALVAGRVAAARATVLCPVGEGRKGRMRAQAAGKSAETEIEVLERFSAFTLVVARPFSGRTHQIRVHAFAMGHPLAIDPLYRLGAAAARDRPPAIERLTLHAWRYALPAGWPDPRSFCAPPPEDFSRSLEALRAGG